ncbi:LytB [Lactobacillus helsingborgensis]|uniref:SLAP domain-containing protein n=1 Tax=Lactobacillus helsingborgensis TaxID=1218494 RepID=A0AA47B3E7_9LACO|nr:SLAP domain-containing protein [Lactobacillus helsingborgensis]KJY62940.1 LytB [Lactobacillus helsingborgensis]UZX29412.1 SLAP domain-containing protein [Lactobacillus helsingborgensis]
MKKLIAALALGASIATVAAPESLVVQASTINDTAKQNSYGGVTYLDQMLAQEGVQYNDFSSANPINYRNGKPEGVVIHETATPNATAHNEAIYFNREWMNIYAYVHAFVDKTGVIQMTSPDYGVWGAGPVANNRFVQVELCEENNLADFAKGVNNDAIYVAQILHRYNLVPDNAVHDGQGTIWSHHAVSTFLGGTDHTDPDGYFAKWGYSMDDFFDLVKYYYDQGSSTTNTGIAASDPVVTKPVETNKPTKKPVSTILPKPVGTKILIHNALVYDENGVATKLPTKKAGTKLTIYGNQTIKKRKYLQIGINQYVVASNVEGKLQRLSHNAFIYDGTGQRIGTGKLYRGNYVRTYGGRVKIKGRKYYPIDVNQFIKVGNFK